MDFTGARLKIERADRHIRELEDAIAAFRSSDKHRFVFEKDPVTNAAKASHESSAEVLKTISLITGDVVHNLRAALDHLMFEVVTSLDPTVDPDIIKFPISNNENAIKTALEKAEIKSAISTPLGTKIARVILNEIKPYGALDNAICAVSKLDNIDKHRLVLATFGEVAVTFTGTDARENVFVDCGAIGKLGTKMNILHTNVPMKAQFKSVIEIFIGEAKFPKNETIVPALKNISKVVTQALEAIERCIIGHGTPL
jgi:hypothetical protein